MPGLDDYGALLRSAAAAVPDYAEQQAQQQLLGIRKQQMQLQTAELMQKLAQKRQFDDDVKGVLADPSAGNISNLMLKHPEFSDQVKASWDVRDKAAKTVDLTQLGEIYSLASAGKWDAAAKAARTRFEADKAAGHADPSEEQIVSALESQDPAERNAALGMIGVQVAAATGPEHFGTVYGQLQGDYTLESGGARFNRSGQMIAHSPFIKDDAGNIRLWTDSGASGSTGQPATGTAPAPPPADPDRVAAPTSIPGPPGQVASTLAASGLPAPVVAGFLGNFHIEGGYGGAKGDGGSANGIGQWHDDRAANFERVVGKPISEATPEEQAGFVVWEMQHPEAAGMTVEQRDAILSAKTGPQAAALIDQFYERSSGEHRQRRMQSASAFADAMAPDASQPYYSGPPSGGAPGANGGGQFPVVIPGKPKDAPSGYRWSADGKSLEIIPGGPAEQDAGLDDQTLGFYADQVLAGAPMPALGMGKAAARARQEIMKKVALKAKSLGIEGGDLAAQQAHFANAKKALGVLETQAGTIGANENTALANGQQFLDRSRELSLQTRFPIVNSATMAYLRHTGDDTVAAMDAAWQTFTTEYAKVVAGSPSGAGVLSDSARQENQKIMRGNYSLAQKQAAFEQMKRDMANRMTAIRSGIQHGYKDMRHIPGSTQELRVGEAASNEGLPKGARVVGTYKGKRVIQMPNGKRMVEQ